MDVYIEIASGSKIVPQTGMDLKVSEKLPFSEAIKKALSKSMFSTDGDIAEWIIVTGQSHLTPAFPIGVNDAQLKAWHAAMVQEQHIIPVTEYNWPVKQVIAKYHTHSFHIENLNL